MNNVTAFNTDNQICVKLEGLPLQYKNEIVLTEPKGKKICFHVTYLNILIEGITDIRSQLY